MNRGEVTEHDRTQAVCEVLGHAREWDLGIARILPYQDGTGWFALDDEGGTRGRDVTQAVHYQARQIAERRFRRGIALGEPRC